MRDSVGLRPTGHWTVLAVLGTLLALLSVHVIGVALDFMASIHCPIELDYGEGIVWQQAALIPGPRMYGNGQDLPFIVFHYPPLYYLLVHAVSPLEPNLLAAGRLVSSVSATLIAPLVTALVLTAVRRPGRGIDKIEFATALAAGLLVLCLHAVRTWGMVMRVDMVAIALGLMGVLTGAWANGRLWVTAAALLLCVAAMFAKQTQLPAGVAVFLVALLRNPRSALGAAAIAGLLGLGALGLMHELTSGGFLHNIVGYNINRFTLKYVGLVFLAEWSSFLFIGVMLLAAGATLFGLSRPRSDGPWSGVISQTLLRLRLADRPTTARAMLLLHFALASLMLVTVFKSGASFNYLLDWLCVGTALIGVLLCDLASDRRRFVSVALVLILGVLILPFRQMPDQPPQEQLAQQTALVRRIAEAKKPVASENMTLLMQAGKPVIFEPAIVTELAVLGKWDETPLVGMIRSGGFAFMITTDDRPGGGPRRTPAVDAAMRAAYPRVEQVGPELWLNMPAD
jgi:hypothetical protein